MPNRFGFSKGRNKTKAHLSSSVVEVDGLEIDDLAAGILKIDSKKQVFSTATITSSEISDLSTDSTTSSIFTSNTAATDDSSNNGFISYYYNSGGDDAYTGLVHAKTTNADWYLIKQGGVISDATDITSLARTDLYLNNLIAADGSAASPSIHGSDSDTGFYFTTNTVGISTGGFERVLINNSYARFDQQIQCGNGTFGLPVFSFENDSDTGMYLSTAGKLAFTCDGVETMTLTNTTIDIPNSSCRFASGVVSNPSIGFSSDTDTGLFYNSGIGFTTSGSERMNLSDTKLVLNSIQLEVGTIKAGQIDYTGGTTLDVQTNDLNYDSGAITSDVLTFAEYGTNESTPWGVGLISTTAADTTFNNFAITLPSASSPFDPDLAMVIDNTKKMYVKDLDISNRLTLPDGGSAGSPNINIGASGNGIYNNGSENWVRFSTNGNYRVGIVADGMIDCGGVASGDGTGDSSINNNTAFNTTYIKKYMRFNGQEPTKSFYLMMGTDNASDLDAYYDSFIIGRNDSGIDPEISFVIDSSDTVWMSAANIKNSLVIPTYTPTSASDSNGEVGEITYDSSYIYIKTGASAWRRVAHATW